MNEMELIPLLFPGSQRQIEAALRQIGRKFPDVDLSPVNIPSGENPQSAVLVPDIMQVMPGISQVTIILLSLSPPMPYPGARRMSILSLQVRMRYT